MTKVILDMSMSLDGYMSASAQTPEEPVGEGGFQLTEWSMGEDAQGAAVLEEMRTSIGAMVAGRRTYDTSLPWWGPDGPSREYRLPLFVVSHGKPEDIPDNSVYTFVEGAEAALEEAKAAAGDKDVEIMGGAKTGQRLIRAGLVDEIHIHLVPVLFGSGTRLFENLGDDHIQLEAPRVTEGPTATHLRYQVAKDR